MPAIKGKSTVVNTTILATTNGETLAGIRKIHERISIASGTNMIDIKPAAMSSPIMYEVLPPAFSAFFGSTGGRGETASAISAILTAGWKSNSAASVAANTGMITFIDRKDFASNAGLRRRYVASPNVAVSPMLITSRMMLAFRISGISSARVITEAPRTSSRCASTAFPVSEF